MIKMQMMSLFINLLILKMVNISLLENSVTYSYLSAEEECASVIDDPPENIRIPN